MKSFCFAWGPANKTIFVHFSHSPLIVDVCTHFPHMVAVTAIDPKLSVGCKVVWQSFPAVLVQI